MAKTKNKTPSQGIERGCSKKKHHISRTTCSILLLSGTIEIGDQGEQCVMLKDT